MEKYTQKQLRGLVESKAAIDISHGTNETRNQIEAEEEYLNQIGYAAGMYRCNGMLFAGHNTGRLYAITGRTSALYIFH